MGIEMTYNHVDLSYSNFSGAKLNSANLIDDNLTNADFTGASVIGANFTNSILYQAKISAQQLATALSVCDAILPDGSRGKC